MPVLYRTACPTIAVWDTEPFESRRVFGGSLHKLDEQSTMDEGELSCPQTVRVCTARLARSEERAGRVLHFLYPRPPTRLQLLLLPPKSCRPLLDPARR